MKEKKQFFFFFEKRGIAATYLLNCKIEKNSKGSSCWMGWRGGKKQTNLLTQEKKRVPMLFLGPTIPLTQREKKRKKRKEKKRKEKKRKEKKNKRRKKKVFSL